MAKTTFRVTVPGDTPDDVTVYIAGDFQGWLPGSADHALTRADDGRWVIELDLPPRQPVQFKFTLGGWDRVEKGPEGEEISNRTLMVKEGGVHEFTVASWAATTATARERTVTGYVESASYPDFLAGRRCWIYLPPGYEKSDERYPVLYMHDGQNLFDETTSFAGEWEVDETLQRLIPAGEVPPIIVVGIENAQLGRCSEYTPWPGRGSSCEGGGADAYLAAMRDVLIPRIDSRYRTRTGPANTALCGSSLGGLISAYAGYAMPEVFGRVAAVSPAYQWDNGKMLEFAREKGRPDLHKFYQDMGTQEAVFSNRIPNYLDLFQMMREIAVSQGFVEGKDFLSIVGEGQKHHESDWARRFPGIVKFLFEEE
jgi:pullulanase